MTSPLLGLLVSLPILAGSFGGLLLYASHTPVDAYPGLWTRAEAALEALDEFAGLDSVLAGTYEDAKSRLGLTREEFRIDGERVGLVLDHSVVHSRSVAACPVGVLVDCPTPTVPDLPDAPVDLPDLLTAAIHLPFGPNIPLVETGSYGGVFRLSDGDWRLTLTLWRA